MNKIKLEEGLWVYSFLPTFKNEFVSYNLVVLVDGTNVLLVDTAFKRHFNPLMEELKEQGLEVTHAITTHHHKDHIGGLIKLYGKETYASSRCDVTLNTVFKGDDYHKYLPKYKVDEVTEISFGRFAVKMIPNPGHSCDGLHVVINDTYVIAGDDILFTEDQIPLLPFAADGNLEAHTESLKKLKEYMNDAVLIPSHGQVIYDNELIVRDIENRIRFLEEKLLDHEMTSEKFEEKTGIYFFGYPWYSGNV
jgi:glyoxylase-like metal-dependent hydrolase (beta-lactamase superfamily II)